MSKTLLLTAEWLCLKDSDYNIGGILLCYIIALHIKLPSARSFKPCISNVVNRAHGLS